MEDVSSLSQPAPLVPPSPPSSPPPTPPSPPPPLLPDQPTAPDILDPARLDAFLARWSAATGTERANYQLFLTELCALLDLPPPDPAREDTQDNAYCFERRVIFQHGDGTQSQGFIDLYRRTCFVLECKQTGLDLDSRGWDKAMLRAHGQAVQYARALPASEGRPPFVVVVDVGRGLELYSEFSRSGGAYLPYPDPRSHRLRLDDLRRAEIRARLRALWLEPLSLDPSRHAARVTRAIATRLARLAVSLEQAGHAPEVTAAFLIRCLFTLFAEDVGLIKTGGFTELLHSIRDDPAQFVPLTEHLWREMNTGAAFSVILRERVLRFNGGLFATGQALPLTVEQLDLLLDAGRADWRQVEPAIFGTLLERALDPVERHALGAHYTPRAYVERLVLPTVIAPLREEWTAVHSATFSLHEQGKDAEAIKLVNAFQVRLATVRVLDPACGSGNFLYVTLEHLKRLEGEVLDTLESLGQRQLLMAMEGVSVDPHQLLGLEVNPRAAAIAETVLWIGYLQWHFRTYGNVQPPEPVIRDFRNIECRDAVLAYDGVDWITDDAGQAVTRWDGRTYKRHPVTGESVPDETAQVPLERYRHPRPAAWPAADFVVGNPPFIGNKRMRLALGDGYVEALRGAWPEVPGSADFVMYWWHKAAELARTGRISRFGFITTNSLTQSFNRQVVEKHLTAKEPLSLTFAIPDHPWVDASEGAAVRIAMSVGIPGSSSGLLAKVTREENGSNEGMTVTVDERFGLIHPDLTIGARAASAVRLEANRSLCFQGMNLVGRGFRITSEDAQNLGYSPNNLPEVIKPHRNARDMMQGGGDVLVIDLFGYSAEKARIDHPSLYQHLLDRVKPERDHNKDAQRRRDWWLFGRSNAALRYAWIGLDRIILTPETAKHRVFAFQKLPFCPDHKLYAICSDDAFVLGVLSSRVHCVWALRAGGRLGFGNDPTWTNTTCFLPFSFPDPAEPLKARIRHLAEELDAHRKARQALHPGLTLTGMYNVLAQLRRGEPLSAKERQIHEQGLVSVLRQLHDELDAAVLAAYGWEDLLPALMAQEQARGKALSQEQGQGWSPGPTKTQVQAQNQTPAKGQDQDQGQAEEEGQGAGGELIEESEAAEGGIRSAHIGPHEALARGEAPAWTVEEEILTRLVALNAERAAEERRGLVRWLRPEFQNPNQGRSADTQTQAEVEPTAIAPTAGGAKAEWPKTLPEQFQALRTALAAYPGPVSPAGLAQGFSRVSRPRVAELLDTLVTLGHARRLADGRYLPG